MYCHDWTLTIGYARWVAVVSKVRHEYAGLGRTQSSREWSLQSHTRPRHGLRWYPDVVKLRLLDAECAATEDAKWEHAKWERVAGWLSKPNVSDIVGDTFQTPARLYRLPATGVEITDASAGTLCGLLWCPQRPDSESLPTPTAAATLQQHKSVAHHAKSTIQSSWHTSPHADRVAFAVLSLWAELRAPSLSNPIRLR